MEILRARDRIARPWKNGGGVTYDIAAHPPQAQWAFDWRISLAQVAADGPFSSFPGIDRLLMVIAGGSLTLAIGGQAPLALSAQSDPVSFPGEAPVTAVPCDGPVMNLNVMTKRGAWTAHVRLIDGSHGEGLIDGAETRLVIALGDIGLRLGDQTIGLKFADAARFDGSEGAPYEAARNGAGMVLAELRRA